MKSSWTGLTSGSQRSGSRRDRVRARLWRALKTLKVKLKILASFFQVATKLESVYGVTLPPQASSEGGVLSIFAFVNLDFFSALPLPWPCLGIGGYQQKLQAMALAPVALVFVLMLAGAVTALRDKQRKVPLLNAWLHAWLCSCALGCVR